MANGVLLVLATADVLPIFGVLYKYFYLESDEAAAFVLALILVWALAVRLRLPLLLSVVGRFKMDRRTKRTQFTQAGRSWRFQVGLNPGKLCSIFTRDRPRNCGGF